MNSDKPVPAAFFTDIDCIFDTRLGTLLRMTETKDAEVEKFLDGGRYFNRDRDLFKGVDPNKFKEAYDKRDKNTLQVSVITKLVNFIFDFGRNIYEGNIKTPFLREPKLIINLYPYTFTQEEKDLLIQGLKMRIGKISSIELVNMSYADITPRYLKQETSIIAIYDPYEWLETHAASGLLRKESCPTVMMLGPLRLRNLDDTTFEIKKFQHDMEMLAKPFVDLELMITTAFSADLLVTKPKTKSNEPKDTQDAKS